MSFGTLYTHNPTPRSTTLLALAKLNNLDLRIVYAEKKNKEAFEELCKYNPFGQVPTFVGTDGFVLSECIPLTLYCTQILQWMSFANSDLFPAIGGVFLPRIGQRQIIRQDDGDSLRVMLQRCKYLDEHLKRSRYLVGESLTIADFFAASLLMGAFAAFRKIMQERFETLCSWYEAVCEVGWFKEVAGGVPDLGLELEIPGDMDW
ncbi:glutathione S-transferase [Aspergillus falconensis]